MTAIASLVWIKAPQDSWGDWILLSPLYPIAYVSAEHATQVNVDICSRLTVSSIVKGFVHVNNKCDDVASPESRLGDRRDPRHCHET